VVENYPNVKQLKNHVYMQEDHKDVTAEREQTKHVRPQNKSKINKKLVYIYRHFYIY
jgi:hypothetical protein